MIFLSIDPGSAITGYGIIKSDGRKYQLIAHGNIILKKIKEHPIKLKKIYFEVDKLIKGYQPEHFAIESVFISSNPQSALKLGQARGAAICAAVNNDLPVFEYFPRIVKKSVVGVGSADKSQVKHMIKILLNCKKEKISEDASDALAVGICHINHL
jgi:crossover junction endodeoxyribonuclease RuvC